MVDYKSIGGSAIGLAMIILISFLAYPVTDNTYYCASEPAKLLENDFGLSAVNKDGLQTRLYLNKEHSSWDFCTKGWLKVSDYIEVEKFVDKEYDEGIIHKEVVDSKTNLTKQTISTTKYAMENEGAYYTLESGSSITERKVLGLISQDYIFETKDGLKCYFDWNMPTALDIRSDIIDFKQGRLSNLECNQKIEHVDGDIYLVGGKYLIDLDPTIIVTNETTIYNWSAGTFNQTQSNTANVSLAGTNTTGNYTSQIFNAGGSANWTEMVWDVTNPTYEDTSIVLLMHFNGSDGDTSFFDASTLHHTYTPHNQVHIEADQSVFGGTSGQFDGALDYLNRTDASLYDLGTGDFTMDLWIRTTDVASANIFTRVILNSGTGYAATDFSFQAGVSSAEKPVFGHGVLTKVVESTSEIDENQWYHVAVVRESGTVGFIIDGILNDTGTNSEDYDADELCIGVECDTYTNNPGFEGYMDELRFVIGETKWSLSGKSVGDKIFDVPTEEYSTTIDPTSFYMQVRNSDDGSTWTAWTNYTSGVINESSQYIQFLAYFDTDDAAYTPWLNEVNITYELLNAAPTVPQLAAPANNSNFIFVPELNWTNSTDSDEDAITYYLQVDNDVNFGSVDYTNSISETTTPTGDTPTGLAEDTWYWRVLATDGTVNSSWNDSFIFTYDNTAPVINILDPTNQSYNITDLWFNSSQSELITNWTINYNGTNVSDFTINTSITVEEGSFNLLVYAEDYVGFFGFNNSINFTHNDAPYFLNSTITNTTDYINATLNCSTRYIDTFNLTAELNISFYKNGTHFNSTTGASNATLLSLIVESASLTKGDNFSCNATAIDNPNFNSTEIGHVLIQNSHPYWSSVSNKSAISGNETNHTNTCTDPDGDTLTYGDNVTGTETAYYWILNTSSGLFQIRPSFAEWLNDTIVINETCTNGAYMTDTEFIVNITAASGGGAPTTCNMECLVVNSPCVAQAIAGTSCTTIFPA